MKMNSQKIKLIIACFFVLTSCIKLKAQDMRYVKRCISTLASPGFGGRGYVGNSRDKAAKFIHRNFSEMALNSFTQDSNYFQQYEFDVNTFPNKMELKLGKKQMTPGGNFLIHAASVGFRTEAKSKLDKVNLQKVDDSLEWIKVKSKFKSTGVYLLHHVDSLCRRLKVSQGALIADLPKACYILPQTQKLTWTVATRTIPSTVLYVSDSSIPKGRKVEIAIDHKWEQAAVSKNVIGYVPGIEVPDSFIVFTAHYDHLGKMGARTVFPGANDNASGTSFLLAAAKYYQQNPQRYSIVFIAFSGEEAGLLGSKYFVEHPVFPLANIKFLLNIDLMGDATDGITVVNAVQQKEAFDVLESLNKQHNYLPKVNIRDNAPNSDHYPFTQNNVPAVFIYANGGKGHYHDIYDKPKELSLNNIPKVFKLVTDFVTSISSK